MTDLLEISAVSKRYRRGTLANDGISLGVRSGEVLGLLGPNGAGKTTLVNQIVAIARPTSGSIRIDGVDIVADSSYARRACSFQPQTPLVFSALSAERAIYLVGRLRGGAPSVVRERTSELLRLFDLSTWAKARTERLSGGIRRLVGFCMATVIPGRVVVLDEPTDDVDPLRRRLLWQEVRRIADRGSAVIVVTHNLLEVERVVDRVALLDRGRLVASGSLAELEASEAASLGLEEIFMAFMGSAGLVPR